MISYENTTHLSQEAAAAAAKSTAAKAAAAAEGRILALLKGLGI